MRIPFWIWIVIGLSVLSWIIPDGFPGEEFILPAIAVGGLLIRRLMTKNFYQQQYQQYQKQSGQAGSSGASGSAGASDEITLKRAEPPELSLRADGNTVDLDKTMGNLAENTLLFKAGAQIISKKFLALKEAIKGGK